MKQKEVQKGGSRSVLLALLLTLTLSALSADLQQGNHMLSCTSPE